MGRILGMISWDPTVSNSVLGDFQAWSMSILVVSKSNRLHADIFRVFFFELEYILSIPQNGGNSPGVLNFNCLFLKLNRHICN